MHGKQLLIIGVQLPFQLGEQLRGGLFRAQAFARGAIRVQAVQLLPDGFLGGFHARQLLFPVAQGRLHRPFLQVKLAAPPGEFG